MSGAPEAIVLVGGQGTRLRPLTLTTAKPLLPVAGVPFLAHQLSRLAAAGIGRVVLATSYQAWTFQRQFGPGSAFGLEIDYATESEPLGTGGGIRNVAGRLRGNPDDPVVVLNGDVLSGHDLLAQLDRHARTGADVTLHLTEVDDARPFGCVPADEQGRVSAFLEKSADPVTNWINAGCYVFRRRVLDEIPPGRVVSVERDTFPALLARGARVVADPQVAYWLDMGTPQAYLRASRDLILGRVDSPALTGPSPGGLVVLPGARIDPAATVDGGTTVGAGAVIGAGARVSGCVLMDGVVIGPQVVAADSALGTQAQVGAGTVLQDAVIGAGARLGAGNELRAGARVWPGVELADRAVRFSSDA